jgi:hypothetical protein
MKSDPYLRSFAGGIVSPSMVGRIDDANRDAGVEFCRNLIILPEGIATSRPGTKFVRETKYSARRSRMIPFRYSSTQTMAIEFGHTYIRFHSYGATLLTPTSGVSAWSAVPPYSAGDLVTYGGSTWYAVSDVPANKQPDLFVYGSGVPIVTGTWVESAALSATPPVGYTYVGTELPSSVTIGQLVYISVVTYTSVPEIIEYGEGGGSYIIYTEVATVQYIGYTGTATGSSPADFWYEMGVEYEIPNPYDETHIPDIHYVQSGDVLTLVHPQYAPRELRRLGATSWTLAEIAFGSTLTAPTISSVTAHNSTLTAGGDTINYSYVATNVADDQLDESVASAVVSVNGQLADTGAFNTVTFGDAVRRNVYKLSGGLYGFIGQTVETTLTDDNVAPDLSRTPPEGSDPFATDWPGAVTYFGQRRGFGGTTLLPQSFWLTKVGTESNLDSSIPVRDDDAITVKIAAREAATIRHMVPLGDLIILTSSGEFSVSSDGPLTPGSARRSPTTGYVGASNVQPVIVDDDLIYAAARGGRLRGMGYSFDRQRYVSVDLCVRASHLFDFRTIKDMAFTRAPTPIVWSVSSNGDLIGMTYVPSEEVRCFHTHFTDGAFESICAVAEGDEDILYAIVKRTIGGSTVRYVECFAPRFFTEPEDAFYVDCGATYDGAAATTISGLDHLIGETVAILADGAVVTSQEVSVAGEITLDTAASVVQVGLPLTRQLTTLPVAVENVPGYGQAVPKNVCDASVNVLDCGAFFVGPDEDNLRVIPMRSTEAWGSPPDAHSGYEDVTLDGQWNDKGQITIISSEPTPLTLLSILKRVEFGG